MLVYEKKVDEARHLFGNATGTAPTVDDVQLTYKDSDGDTLTIVEGDSYIDDGKGGIIRKSDDKPVNVFIGDTQIIGSEIEEKTITGIEVIPPTKVIYDVGDALDLTGMVVKEVYSDGDKKTITTGYTTSPADQAILAATDTKVTVTHTASSKTAEFNITVE